MWFLLATIFLDYWPIIRNEGEFVTVTHDQYGFSITYPTKWKISLYGEDGYRGNDDVKLQLYRNNFNVFRINVFQKNLSDATLEDAYYWQLEHLNRLTSDYEYSEISLNEDEIRGHAILRHQYVVNNTQFEAVYFVRASDMFSIRLQAPVGEFESYLEEFRAIVVSFRPLD